MTTTKTTTTQSPNPRSALRSQVLDVAVPVGAYYALSAFGVSTFAALALSSLYPLGRALLQWRRERRINGLAAIIVAVNLLGMALTAVSGDVRMMLVKDSLGSGFVGLATLVSAVTARPVLNSVFRTVSVQGHPEREPVWDGLVAASPAFRAVLRRATVLWGVGLLVECAVRVVLVYTLPVSAVVGLGPVVLVGAILLINALSVPLVVRPIRARMRAAATGESSTGHQPVTVTSRPLPVV